MSLNGRVALVTGAGRGIGAAVARTLAAAGAAVVVNDVDGDRAAAVVRQIRDGGGMAIAAVADVTVQDEVRATVDTALDEFDAVDILVNNARIGPTYRSFPEMTWTDLERKVVLELKAAFYCCQAVVPRMIERRYGRIVMIGSDMIRNPRATFMDHVTSKSALLGMAKSLAVELGAYGITVNTVGPGFILTEATGRESDDFRRDRAGRNLVGRNGLPDDIARAVLAFASDGAGFITGTYLPVNGGAVIG